MKKTSTILACLIIISMIGCAGSQPRVGLTVPQSDASTLYARGLSTTLLVEEAADNAAALRARNGLAAIIETHIKSLTKQASEQIGIGKDAELNSSFSEAIKQIVNQSLNFATQYKKAPTIYDKRLGAYRAEVIFKIDIGPINDQIMENIKARKNLYERFRTTELFEELEKETQ